MSPSLLARRIWVSSSCLYMSDRTKRQGGCQSTLVVIGLGAQPQETSLLRPSSRDVQTLATRSFFLAIRQPALLLAIPSSDLSCCAFRVRNSKTNTFSGVSFSSYTDFSLFLSFCYKMVRFSCQGCERAAAGYSGYWRVKSLLSAWHPQAPINQATQASDLIPS